MRVNSSRLRSALFLRSLTSIFMPDSISLGEDIVQVVRRRWLGLVQTTDEVMLNRVASIRVVSRILTATIVIETFGGGGSNLTINYLPKKAAEKLVFTIRAAMARQQSET